MTVHVRGTPRSCTFAIAALGLVLGSGCEESQRPSALLRPQARAEDAETAALIAPATKPRSGVESPAVRFGIDVLQDDGFGLLEAMRVGLVVNPASVNLLLERTSSVLEAAPEVTVSALFGPEHGVYGDEHAGSRVSDRVSPSGTPIFSLYGRTRRPTAAMLENVDVVVFDLQGIGSRSYTFISTLKAVLDACVEHDRALVVLDRPNPLGGVRVEGPGMEDKYKSFVGAIDVPYVHGMTMGELALLMRARHHPNYDRLTVVPLDGWRRDMVWEDLGREWIPTSPHIPRSSSCAAYAATGIAGELLTVSNGVGFTLPFELLGSPDVDADLFAEALTFHWETAAAFYARARSGTVSDSAPGETPAGLKFQPTHYKPFYASSSKKTCHGVQIFIDPKEAETLVELNYRALEILGAGKELSDDPSRRQMFDRVSGSAEPRMYLEQGLPLAPLFEKWRTQSEEFRRERAPYLLY